MNNNNNTVGWKCFLSIVSVGLGIFAFVETQRISKAAMEPIAEACQRYSNDNEALQSAGYQPYEPMLGGTFICIITQFVYALRTQLWPAGLLTWGTIIVVNMPLSVLIIVEAGRRGTTGLVRYPAVLCVLAQFVGISVVVPLLWVPGYIWGASCPHGSVALFRARFATLNWIAPVALTVCVFWLDPTASYAWTVSAGILAGPLLAMTPALLWTAKPPPAEYDARATRTIAAAYGIVGAVAFVGWIYLLYVAFVEYGHKRNFDLRGLASHLYGAHYAVSFMTIDTAVLYAGLVVYLVRACHRFEQVAQAVLLSTLLGPGAGPSLILAQLEMERGVVAQEQEARKQKED